MFDHVGCHHVIDALLQRLGQWPLSPHRVDINQRIQIHIGIGSIFLTQCRGIGMIDIEHTTILACDERPAEGANFHPCTLCNIYVAKKPFSSIHRDS
ncbi:hypothetical protein ASD22_15360 [Rhodanobacter sp. Root480]|nr:hypothetical protein ASD22_15360 [Rhodanobacter sp. Root480]